MVTCVSLTLCSLVCFPHLLQSVEERCVYGINSENSNWTEIKREAWISSKVYGLSRAIQVSALEGETCISVVRVKGKQTFVFTYTLTCYNYKYHSYKVKVWLSFDLEKLSMCDTHMLLFEMFAISDVIQLYCFRNSALHDLRPVQQRPWKALNISWPKCKVQHCMCINGFVIINTIIILIKVENLDFWRKWNILCVDKIIQDWKSFNLIYLNPFLMSIIHF